MKGASKTMRGRPRDVARKLLDEGHHAELLALVDKLVAKNEELERLIASARTLRNRAETVSSEQLRLILDELAAMPIDGNSESGKAEADEKLAEAAKKHGGREEKTKPPKQPALRRPPPPNLRRVDNPITVPEAERRCPKCLAMRKCVDHETTEVIDLIPAEVIVRVDRREILACDRCDQEPIRAPLGDKVISGGAYGSRLVSDLVVNKFWNGLPLNRQHEMLERLGLDMPNSSMGDQIHWATELLEPIHRRLIGEVLTATVLHVDATSLPVKDKDSATGLTIGSLWGYVGDESGAVFLYTRSGHKVAKAQDEIGPETFLAERKGFVVADAAGILDASFERDDLVEVGCNMHARRYFVKALDAGDKRAAVPLAAFKALYDVEAEARALDADGRLGLRQRRSKPIYDELANWSRTYRPLEPPESKLATATAYLLNHELALTRFLGDGRLPIDNGIVERLHRRPAVGRRSYLFAGSHEGAKRAAIAYSVCATCNLLGVDPVAYLADVLPTLARGIAFTEVPRLMPAAWKRQRAASG